MGLAHWFSVWRDYLRKPNLAEVAALLGRSETGILVKGRRAQKARALARIRDRWLCENSAELEMAVTQGRRWTDDGEELLAAVQSLESMRGRFQRESFVKAMERLVPLLASTSERATEEAEAVMAVVDQMEPLVGKVKRDAGFWLEMMLSELGEKKVPTADDRVLDVQGWVELLFEKGRRLVICGMNENRVPTRTAGEPWVSEAVCEKLGLAGNEERAARDAWLLTAMIQARRKEGQVDLICGKVRNEGDTQLPSRLLLATTDEGLPERVSHLFRELPPPEGDLTWSRDWKWNPGEMKEIDRVGVTNLRDYIQCPFRFYLKYAKGMFQNELGRGEWNARDYGTVLHEVLENWGRDLEARELSKTEAIEEWVHADLDRLVADWFGNAPPLAVMIQIATMKRRLSWFSRVQACDHAEGWRVLEVEKKVEHEIGGVTLVGKVDRIDRHQDGRWRVLDYKTGQIKYGVAGEHLKSAGGNAILAKHLRDDSRYLWNGKKAWKNVQLPLYAAILKDTAQGLPDVGYFLLGDTQTNVRVELWKGFDESVRDSAYGCTELIAEKIAASEFWPPVEKGIQYDDYESLKVRGEMGEAWEEIRPPDLMFSNSDPRWRGFWWGCR